MKNSIAALGTVAGLFAAGCVTTSVQKLDTAPRQPRAADSVEVLDETPRRAHAMIAIVEATGETVFDEFDDVRAKLVTEAARLGGDAVVVGPEITDTAFILAGTAMIRSDTRKLAGVVIVYEPETG